MCREQLESGHRIYNIIYDGDPEFNTRKYRKSIHNTKDPEYSIKGLDPTEMSCVSPDENLAPMTVPPTSPTEGLEPKRRTPTPVCFTDPCWEVAKVSGGS